MAQVTQETLRMEILSEAINSYKALRELLYISDAEATLCSLKIAECEAMMKELIKGAFE